MFCSTVARSLTRLKQSGLYDQLLDTSTGLPGSMFPNQNLIEWQNDMYLEEKVKYFIAFYGMHSRQ